MAMAFKKAEKSQAYLRMALIGVSGSGKTYTGLLFAMELAKIRGTRVAVIDSERGSASKYADIFDFDVLELTSFHPHAYCEALDAVRAGGYGVALIDSLSHAWMGKDGALEQVDNVAARSRSSNNFAAWREVTPMHNDLVDAMLRANFDLIVTMRAKSEYIVEDVNGKKVPKKIGMAPVQRDGMEYEFDIVADLDLSHTMSVAKSRYSKIDGKAFRSPGADVAKDIGGWLTDGKAAPALQLVGTTPQTKPAPETRPSAPASAAGEAAQPASAAAGSGTVQPEHPRDRLIGVLKNWSGITKGPDLTAVFRDAWRTVGVPWPKTKEEKSPDADIEKVLAWAQDCIGNGLTFTDAVAKPKVEKVEEPPAADPAPVVTDDHPDEVKEPEAPQGEKKDRPKWPVLTKSSPAQVDYWRRALVQLAGTWLQTAKKGESCGCSAEELVANYEQVNRLPAPGDMPEVEAAKQYKAAAQGKPIDWSAYAIPF